MNSFQQGCDQALQDLGFIKVAAEHTLVRMFERFTGSGTKGGLQRYHDSLQDFIHTLNTQHTPVIHKLPEKWYIKHPEGFIVGERIQSPGLHSHRMITKTVLKKDMSLHRDQKLFDSDALHKALGIKPPRGPRTNLVLGLREKANLSLRKAKNLGEYELKKDPGRLTPSLRLPSTEGGAAPTHELFMSKNRLSKMLPRFQGYKKRGVKFASYLID